MIGIGIEAGSSGTGGPASASNNGFIALTVANQFKGALACLDVGRPDLVVGECLVRYQGGDAERCKGSSGAVAQTGQGHQRACAGASVRCA